jgi:hypothetical protein
MSHKLTSNTSVVYNVIGGFIAHRLIKNLDSCGVIKLDGVTFFSYI